MKNIYRMLAMLLCIVTIFSLFGVTILAIAQALDFSNTVSRQEETSADIRLQLLRKIRSGWDPYSEDMTLDEFYVLMEMFEDGTLPLKNVAAMASVNAQTAAGASSEAIPREMFLFAGLSGADFGSDTPLAYDDATGAPEERDDYPPGLDPYHVGYLRPPMNWSGVETVGMQTVIVKKGVNDNNFAVAGDVIQDRFLSYDGYYVKQVTVEGIDAAVLGVVQRPTGGYVYYYLSAEGQSSTVSTTTMAMGGKFIVQYAPNEHKIDYKVYLNTDPNRSDWDSLADFNAFEDVTDDWADSIFGASRPLRTTDGAYSFDVSTPYEYEVRLYRQKGDEIGQYTGKSPIAGYDLINDGYPLGAEPVYELVAAQKKLLPNTDKGPSSVKTNATLYNNLVFEDRTVIAVVTKKDTPKFDAYRLLPRIDNTTGRGTSALVEIKAKLKGTNTEVTIPYDYEDLYLWATGGDSKYDYYEDSRSLGKANKSNIIAGNIATADNWVWNNSYAGISDATMNQDDDGTYSYRWTWQTNNNDAFLLDTLEINGVSISIPYFPKDSVHNGTKKAGTETGIKGYYTESTLPDGAVVKVEMLMAFADRPQRVYRITVTGARTNVTLTNMNLFMFGSGAPEVAVYALEGVYSGEDANDQSPSIQYFHDGWRKGALADVLVETGAYGEGVQYNVENDFHGANIRFKLADGYGNPYYLFEDPYGSDTTVIDGQASADRNLEDLTITPHLNRIKKMSELGETEKLDPRYIYEGADGWFYIRLTGHTPKFALLTIGAIHIKYVVHYIPETSEVPEPDNMPTFEHTDACPTFVTDSSLKTEYDDNTGLFYDTFKNNMIAIPSDASGVLQPTDPKSNYLFVDWVLVDENGEPIVANGKEFHFFSQAIDLTTIDQYTIFNNELGGDAVDVYVIRLKPTWKKITDPFKYNIVLNWVDAQGGLHQEKYKGNWDEVLTESPVNGESLYVYVNKLAEPFWDWIAQHPTYAFWDNVNNASDEGDVLSEEKIRDALIAYLSGAANLTNFDKIFDAMTGLSDGTGQAFIRLGSSTFAVNQKGGEISLWMYEDKGGIVFKKDVQEESFKPNEEFYFTVTDVTTAAGHTMLNGTYKAYPKKILDSNGNDVTTNADAWDVTFDNGNIVSIVKNGKDYGKYFSLKHGEEIRLYIPEGTYNIVELGSSSGGTYKVEVEYDGTDPQSSSWDLPTENQWLQGKRTEVTNGAAGVSQVTAKVDAKAGAHNVVQNIIFHNQTSSISIEKKIGSIEENKDKIPPVLYTRDYTFYVKLQLPAGYSPLEGTRANGESYFYFNMNISGSEGTIELKEADGYWTGEFKLKAGQRAVIVMTVPGTVNTDINYWITEDQTGFDTDYEDVLTVIYTNNEGKAVPAACAEVEVLNRYGGYGYLVITEEGGDPNDSFLYRIIDKNGNELIVSVKGGGKTVVYAPCGKYTIEEISDWSWRYEDGICKQSTGSPNYKTATVTITGENDTPEHAVHADYTHKRKNKGWLGGETGEDNRFNPLTIDEGEEQDTNSRKSVTHGPAKNG